MNDASNFSQRLAALLAERNMTQLELAARIGVTRAAMSRYVSGEREPRLVTLVRIAEDLVRWFTTWTFVVTIVQVGFELKKNAVAILPRNRVLRIESV